MSSFSKRLVICLRKGQMTKADLRRWFDRSYSTIETWVDDARSPKGPRAAEAERRLGLLEKGIAAKRGFPVPVDLSLYARPAYIEKLAHDHIAGVSRKNTPRRRVQMRNGVS